MSNLEFIADLLKLVIGLDNIIINDDLFFKDIPGWDSFKSVEFLIEFESRLGIQLSTDQIESLVVIKDTFPFIKNVSL
jgi:acyl carrier protein